MDLVIMGAVLDVAEATMILATTTINIPSLDPRKEETLSRSSGPCGEGGSTSPNGRASVAAAGPAAAAEASVTARNKTAGGERQRNDRARTGHSRCANSAQHSGGRT